jgi:hypothetical protein
MLQFAGIARTDVCCRNLVVLQVEIKEVIHIALDQHITIQEDNTLGISVSKIKLMSQECTPYIEFK